VTNSKKSASEIELLPDAWARFERAAGVVAKSPPQHRVAQQKTKTKKAAKKRPKSQKEKI
jgi:hypothetical protein